MEAMLALLVCRFSYRTPSPPWPISTFSTALNQEEHVAWSTRIFISYLCHLVVISVIFYCIFICDFVISKGPHLGKLIFCFILVYFYIMCFYFLLSFTKQPNIHMEEMELKYGIWSNNQYGRVRAQVPHNIVDSRSYMAMFKLLDPIFHLWTAEVPITFLFVPSHIVISFTFSLSCVLYCVH